MFNKSFLVVAIFFLASVCYAQEIRNPTSIGPQIGWHKAADADDGQLMYGGALKLKLTNALGFEGSLNYREEDYLNGAVTVSQWPVLLSGLFYVTPNIYGLAGVGWYNTKLEFDNTLIEHADKSSQEFGWHFGAGVDIPLSRAAFLTTDFRYTFIDYEFQEVPGAGEINSDFFIVKAGLMFVLNPN
jgi:opacity protein-like surface antigen